MSVANVPNHPLGNVPRSVADLLANFDGILAAVNAPGLDAANLVDGTLVADKLADAVQDLVGLNDSLNAQRRGYVEIKGGATETALAVSPTFTDVMAVTLNVPAGACVLVASDVEAVTTSGSGQIAGQLSIGPTSPQVQFLATIFTTSSYKYNNNPFALISEVTSGVRTITLQASVQGGTGGKIRNRHMFAMVLDF